MHSYTNSHAQCGTMCVYVCLLLGQYVVVTCVHTNRSVTYRVRVRV